MANRQIQPEEERHILMQEWASVIQYWATDNSILWQRCSVFLLVNSILFAPLAIAPANTLMPIWIVKYGAPLLAVAINILWLLVNLRSIAYTRHFQDLVEDIRKQIPLLHFQDSERLKFRWYERVKGKKYILKLLPALFLVFWVAILVIAVL